MLLCCLFGQSPVSSELKAFLEEAASKAAISPLPDAEIKSYPDAVYFNYYPLGISLMFIPHKGSTTKGQLDHATLSLDSIDVYNVSNDAASTKGEKYAPCPLLPLDIPLLNGSEENTDTTPQSAVVTAASNGRDLVQALGEPTRKGGGAGPSSGSISIWCEWSKHGIMVEFGGDEARGPQAWERGKDAVWKIITLFKPPHEDNQ
ncbi:hypothetical protein BU17DRAFT_46938 [Hysterangium stoloniferum]|nr:hypothetical protein BU17DRAFT_46938 [Hysterangium stoloniferum]